MAQTQQSIQVVTNMKHLSLFESMALVNDFKFSLEELVGKGNPVNLAYAEERCKQIIPLLGPNISLVDNADAADVFFTLEGNVETAMEHDVPVIGGTYHDIIFAWEDHETLRKTQYIHKLTPVVTELLRTVEPNYAREGLAETPARFAKAWAKWTEGYEVDIPAMLKVFEDGAEKCDEMVIVKDIPIYSKCEHHLADIFGTATIAYIPNGKIVGLSKLSRLADAFGRRLQVQERLTNQIADALETHLEAKGVAVLIRARHMCMESRGLCQQGHHTITSALRGVMKTDHKVRDEFISLANSSAKP